MRIAVIGAGIIGVTTAWELAADGHEVTVFERRASVAEETSFANAGVVAPGYVTPWAAPGMPAKVARFLLSEHAPVRVSFPLSAADMKWMWRWYRACDLAAYQANRARLQRLAFYSRKRLDELTEALQLEYDRSTGYMVLLRGDKDRQMVQPGLAVLREAGVTFREIGPDEARAVEPALNPDTKFAGAIHLPQDGVGNCRQFALLLKAEAQARGVRFEFNTAVSALDAARPTSLAVWSLDAQAPVQRAFDAVVICGGVDSAALLQPLGLNVPLAPVYGYSISAPIREPLNAPRSALMDERYKVAISRLGNRVRVAGSAEIGGTPDRKRPAAIQTLYKVLHDWFPGAAQLANTGAAVQEWKGARPMLPDGPPMLGATGIPGVWINLGHGSSGWALSCGSARAVADLMGGRAPEVDVEGLGVERLHA
ncbi:D-amino acid dehydrogenase [Caenimonas aquaedulcis]|uniref:D-amino acid dehydrogenase n=1 Tax=Caenimonas aquaedulcis TaxID=2793270 RepID=A0A931H180_9BURK|nr:D-amino acid dehydrogenase [Caenimonas aquaedulcis]MBG9386709.1 D-amino acid dehydrogenase [Caenimonas aquaedulcis]